MSMKKNIGILITVALGLVLLLAACGEKSQEDVVAKLEDKIEEMDGYKAKAEMKMNTGQDDQEYQLDVWHKKKDLYRLALTNPEDEKGSQVILKNEDGVFVLTPALDKDRKSTRLNSSHVAISYADCCLKKKKLQGDIEGEVTLSHSVRDTIGSQFDTGPVGFDGHEYYIWKSRLTKVTVAIGMS